MYKHAGLGEGRHHSRVTARMHCVMTHRQRLLDLSAHIHCASPMMRSDAHDKIPRRQGIHASVKQHLKMRSCMSASGCLSESKSLA